MNNRVNATMTAAQVAAVKTAIQTISTNMPFLVGLTVQERMSLPKINVVNKAFAEDAINAVVNNAGSVPSYLSPVQMQNDLLLFTQLDELTTLLRQVLEKAEDTQILAGSEAYIGALTGYKLFGAAADAGVAGADTIYAALRQRFQSVPPPAAKQSGTAE